MLHMKKKTLCSANKQKFFVNFVYIFLELVVSVNVSWMQRGGMLWSYSSLKGKAVDLHHEG